MYRYEDIKLRKFTFNDIIKKIEWINNSQNNKYLHYDLPLEYEKTCKWYENIKDNKNRFDAVIEYQGEAIGLIGLLNIDTKNKKAEDYIIIGETDYKNKGIATKAGILIALYGFNDLKLNKIYAYTEIGNENTLKLYMKKGYEVEGILKSDLYFNNKYIDRYSFALLKENFEIPKEVFYEGKNDNSKNS